MSLKFSAKDSNLNNSNNGSKKNLPNYIIGFFGIALIIFCIYQLQKMDRLARKFAEKESQWQTKYAGYEEKLRLNEAYQKEQQQKLGLLEQKNSELQNKQFESELHFAELNILKNTDDLLLMQIKPLLYQTAQQLKFGQNIEQALAILQDVSQQINNLENTKWQGLNKAISMDIERLKQANAFDKDRALKKLETLSNLKNQITYVNQEITENINNGNGQTSNNLWQAIKNELNGLFRVEKTNSNALNLQQTWFYQQQINIYINQLQFLIKQKQTQELKVSLHEIENITQKYLLKTPKNQEFIDVLNELKLLSETEELNIQNTINALEAIDTASS